MGAGCKIVLRHQFITLMVMLGTIVLTGYLYVDHSEGLLSAAGYRNDRRHDRGRAGHFLPGHVRAPAGRRQHRAAEIPRWPRSAPRSAPAARPPTLNDGRMFIALKPKDQRKASADEVINRLRPKLARLQGITLYMQAAQDITIGGRLSQDAVSVYADRCRSRRTQPLVRAVPGQAQDRSRGSPTSPATSRMPARCSTSPSTATSPRATASCRRRSTTRCRTPSASASSPPC